MSVMQIKNTQFYIHTDAHTHAHTQTHTHTQSFTLSRIHMVIIINYHKPFSWIR